MEEPPSHVKFILCTTEAEKVLPTIQSRCQRFDFRNIPVARIAEHLTSVLEQEKLAADPELLHNVAILGNGSMRDALTLLDRLIASGEKHLTIKHLEELLGLPERSLVAKLIDAASQGDAAGTLGAGAQLLSKGTSIDTTLESLIARLRDLMILAACGPTTNLVDLSEVARKEEAQRASRFDPAGLVHMIALCENVQRAAKNSSTPRALFDALLVRLAMTDKLADVTAVVSGRTVTAQHAASSGGAATKKA
jgi:DNA polymerase-3 subunit gamma/tau